jgi:outer membrane protein OmpA-like peptidoglycan-associated protein
VATNEVIANTISNNDGKFSISVKAGAKYRLVAEKESFFYLEKEVIAKEGLDSIQFVMERKPGYSFDVSIISAERIQGTARMENLVGARIEVYNNTRRRQELSLRDHPISSFKFNFEEGNHYTIMVRKKGYLTKRIEAYINIKGCILCFDGMGMVRPNVVDVLANENQLGSFLGTLEMEPVSINKTFTIEDLYYDYNKFNIRPDAAQVLDNVLTVLMDNPAIQLEMGSHTDARGSDGYNMSLSDKRAKSAMEYLISKGISHNLLTWKGYGESTIINECTNGIKCSDARHERNRRTELKIVGILDEDPLDKKTLKQIIENDSRMAPTPFRENPFLDN